MLVEKNSFIADEETVDYPMGVRQSATIVFPENTKKSRNRMREKRKRTKRKRQRTLQSKEQNETDDDDDEDDEDDDVDDTHDADNKSDTEQERNDDSADSCAEGKIQIYNLCFHQINFFCFTFQTKITFDNNLSFNPFL